MINTKELPMWVHVMPAREKAIMYAVLRAYERWGTIEEIANELHITPYLCYEYTKKLNQSDMLEFCNDCYRLKPK